MVTAWARVLVGLTFRRGAAALAPCFSLLHLLPCLVESRMGPGQAHSHCRARCLDLVTYACVTAWLFLPLGLVPHRTAQRRGRGLGRLESSRAPVCCLLPAADGELGLDTGVVFQFGSCSLSCRTAEFNVVHI